MEVNPKAKGLASPEKREVENWVGGQRLTWKKRGEEGKEKATENRVMEARREI